MTSLPIGLLNALNASVATSPASEKGKDPAGDGFQALLDLGTDSDNGGHTPAIREKAATRRDEDGRDAIASYIDMPDRKLTEAPIQDTAQEEDIEVYVRSEHADKPRPAKEDSKAVGNDSPEPAGTGNANAKPAVAADISKGDAKNGVNGASAQEDKPDQSTGISVVMKLMKALEIATGMPVQSLHMQMAGTGNLAEKLQSLPPEMLQKLQSVLEGIVKILDSGVSVSGKEKAQIAPLFGQMIAILNKPDSEAAELADMESLIGKLQTFSDLIAARQAVVAVTDEVTVQNVIDTEAKTATQNITTSNTELTADNDNKQAEILSKTPASAAKAADMQDATQAQQATAKSENNTVGVQQAVRTDTGSSGSSFSESGSQRDNAMFAFGVARATPQNPGTQAATGASFGRFLQQSAQQPVLEQVIFHVKTAMDSGSSKIQIQLNPAELGKLDIRLEVDADGKTGITVTADNKTTLDLLQRDSRGLERALADAGLKADSGSLNFNLRGDGQDRNQEQAQAAQNYKQPLPPEEPLALDLLNRSYVVNLAEGLDIKI